MADCNRLGKLIGGCKFEPRYDTLPPEKLVDMKGTDEAVVLMMQALCKRIYVCDVCVTCGKTIKR